MKIRIKFLVSIFLLCGVTKAQVNKESFQKTVDLLNCKTIELSLKGNEPFQKFLKQHPCGESGYMQMNQFLTVEKLDATLALSNEIEGLKKLFRDNWKKGDVVNFLSESIFIDSVKYQKIVAFAKSRKDKPEFNDYKTFLKQELEKQLVENSPEENITYQDTIAQQQTVNSIDTGYEKGEVLTKDKSWFSGITSQVIVVSFVISLLFALLILFIASKTFRHDNEVSQNIKDYIKRKFNEEKFNNAFKGSINSLELQDANNRIRYLEEDIRKLNDRLSFSATVTNFIQEKEDFQDTKQPELKTEIFFLSTPNADGSFNESSATQTYKEGATIYRFTKTGSNKAKFQIDEKEASVKLALQYPDKNIDPVCEAENAFNSKATRISTVLQGEVELQGNKWVRNTKAKIRYEN